MILTVAIVIVNPETFVDPRLDTLTPIIRDVFRRTTGDQDSFEVLSVQVAPLAEEGIRSSVRGLISRNTVDWILVVGGIGFEDHQCTPEVCLWPLKAPFAEAPHSYLVHSRQAINPLIERPATAVINHILANAQEPYVIRPSAGTSSHTMITSIPSDIVELRRLLNYFTISAPGFVKLLRLLKNERSTAQDFTRK